MVSLQQDEALLLCIGEVAWRQDCGRTVSPQLCLLTLHMPAEHNTHQDHHATQTLWRSRARKLPQSAMSRLSFHVSQHQTPSTVSGAVSVHNPEWFHVLQPIALKVV